MHSVSAFAGPCWRSSRTDKSARRCHRNGIRGRRAHILRRIVRCYLTAVCSRGNKIICLHEEGEGEGELGIRWRRRSLDNSPREPLDSRARSRRRFYRSRHRDARCNAVPTTASSRSFVSVEVAHLHRRGQPRSPRGTVTLYTHSRSGHPIGRFPRPLVALSRSLPAIFSLLSRRHRIASHRIASRIFLRIAPPSRLTEGCISHNVARGLPQCCACSP